MKLFASIIAAALCVAVLFLIARGIVRRVCRAPRRTEFARPCPLITSTHGVPYKLPRDGSVILEALALCLCSWVLLGALWFITTGIFSLSIQP